jgi:hypothetical protein
MRPANAAATNALASRTANLYTVDPIKKVPCERAADMSDRVRIFALTLLTASLSYSQNWPQWRGPSGDGIAEPGRYPVAFSPTNGLLWKAPLPGKGGSTPVVWGDCIVLTSGVGEGTNGLDGALGFDWAGKPLWQVTFGNQRPGKHRRGSGSCPSPVTDGQRIFVYYKSGTLAALGFDGHVLWKTNLQERYGKDSLNWDLGTSPVLADGKLIVAVMQESNSYVVALSPAPASRSGRPTETSPVWKSVARATPPRW